MKKILFVNPACLDQRVTDDDATVVPIGLYYLAALLTDKGFSAPILNLADPGMGPPGDGLGRFESVIAQEAFSVIGFSVTNANRHQAMECAAIAKKRLKNVAIIFGGPAPTFMPGFFMDACPDLDYIVKGEGEAACLELVKSLGSQNTVSRDCLRQIRGLVFREDGRIRDTGPARVIDDLDTLVPPSRYFTYHHLSMSRGCPGKCTFCGSPKFWGKSGVRFHSAQWFAREIRALAHKGVSHFFISDDTFTMDKPRVMELCALISDLGITWNAISRVDHIDRDMLMQMRKAGCIQISYGVESGSKKIKKILGKPISREKAIRAFSLTASAGIMPRAYFIYGSPGETQETINHSLDLLKRLRPLGAVFYMLVVFPGTHLYHLAAQKKRVTDQIWHERIEDLPWFELDDTLDFPRVKDFGNQLRQAFYSGLEESAKNLELDDDPGLGPFHADFLSRLAMTFLSGEYAQNPWIKTAKATAEILFQRALSFHPDQRAFMGLGMIYQGQKRFKDAARIMDQGLAHFPKSRDLAAGLGVSLMNLGKFSRALDLFKPFKKDPTLGPYINICRQKISGQAND